ncbi:hypothetical protein [Mycobacterium camsae]|uniref:hypothetical protein n=1 Tax=Mycobacterium gordonae TaxID=1778 RepID=UPI00197DE4E5|nr:hypothetical protein [Mycobacterium gordonae]
MTTHDPYDVAEALANAADPCPTEGIRSSIFLSLHAGEPYFALYDLISAITKAHFPIPRDILRAVRDCADWYLHAGSDHLDDMTVKMHQLAASIEDADSVAGTISTFGDAHMGWDILVDAGLDNDSPASDKAEAIRGWLAANRPGWALRYHLSYEGLGYLLDEATRA